MKKTIFTLAITTLIAGSMFIGCQSSAEKVKDAENTLQEAKNDVLDAKLDLNNMRQDSITEYLQFKKESEERIIAYENIISEFKARIAKEKKETREKYERELAKIEQKNSDLKRKLENYKEEGKDKWEAFKSEFNHDMDEMGKAFEDLTVKNVK